jgi:hypothetical protein
MRRLNTALVGAAILALSFSAAEARPHHHHHHHRHHAPIHRVQQEQELQGFFGGFQSGFQSGLSAGSGDRSARPRTR